jgi:hypothetical protein
MLEAFAPFVHRPTEEGYDSICTACASTVGTGTESELQPIEKLHTCDVSNLERFTDHPRSSLGQFLVVCVVLFFMSFAAAALILAICQTPNEPEIATQA